MSTGVSNLELLCRGVSLEVARGLFETAARVNEADEKYRRAGTKALELAMATVLSLNGESTPVLDEHGFHEPFKFGLNGFEIPMHLLYRVALGEIAATKMIGVDKVLEANLGYEPSEEPVRVLTAPNTGLSLVRFAVEASNTQRLFHGADTVICYQIPEIGLAPSTA